MKELLHAIKCVIILQIIAWGVFTLCDETIFASDEQIALIIGIIFLISILILYFIYINKYIKKYNLHNTRFNSFLFILWSIISFLSLNGMLSLVNKKALHVCEGTGWSCFLNGIEYGIYGICMLIIAGIIVLIQFIKTLFKRINK